MVSAIKLNQGTALTWKDSGGDYGITLSSLGNNAGRVGARGDLGAYPRAERWRWYAEAQWTATPTQYGALDFYAAFWDSDSPANPWGQVGSTDSALAAATVLNNLMLVGSVIVEAAAVGPFSAGGVFFAPARYISPVIYNNGAGVALSTSGTFPAFLRLTPIFDEAQ